MANTPLDKQFASLGISNNDSSTHGYESSPNNQRKLGPSIPPKPKKAQPQVPVIPKSYDIPSCLEPSYSTVLNNPNNIPASSSATYANIHSYEDIPSGPIYGNIHREIPLSSYLPPPPPPPLNSACVEEDLPLPPPPLVSDSNLYSALEVTTDMMHFPPPPVDEMTSPPSPVSSSYSELRRAVGSTTGSTNYAPLSQGSNYESLYEPIQPRILNPAMSTLTRASGYNSPYPAYGGSSSSSAGYGTGSMSAAMTAKSPTKEAEVDALTSLLVQSMDNAADPEFFGMCAECGMKVIGEGNGCTAMDRVFHIACFVCRMCGCRLQGKPFYAVDGEPHCQECYLNSLEKCCVCTEPILDRILRATGKPYHPRCFTCVVCGQCLDGIPFTVDAANRIHCIDDFHKKFAPRCSVCHDPIMPEPGKEETVRVVALDRSFHVNCYKCEDCDRVLSSEAEGRGCYPLDGHVLCKSCNAKRVRALTSCVSTEL